MWGGWGRGVRERSGGGSGNGQYLTDLDLVRVLQLVLVGVEDLHVLVGVAVVLLADLRQRVALLDGVRSGGSAPARRATHRAGRSVDVGHQVGVGRIHLLDRVPDLVLGVRAGRVAPHHELAALDLHALDLDLLRVHGVESGLVLLLQGGQLLCYRLARRTVVLVGPRFLRVSRYSVPYTPAGPDAGVRYLWS